MDDDTSRLVCIPSDKKNLDRLVTPQMLGRIEQFPEFSCCVTGDERIALEMQGSSHHPPEHVTLRTTNQIYAGKGGVQSSSGDAVRQSVSAYPSRP